MLENRVKKFLKAVQEGRLGVDEALEKLKILPFSDLDFAKVAHHRELRKGFPEVILCLGKKPSQVKKIVNAKLALSLWSSGK